MTIPLIRPVAPRAATPAVRVAGQPSRNPLMRAPIEQVAVGTDFASLRSLVDRKAAPPVAAPPAQVVPAAVRRVQPPPQRQQVQQRQPVQQRQQAQQRQQQQQQVAQNQAQAQAVKVPAPKLAVSKMGGVDPRFREAITGHFPLWTRDGAWSMELYGDGDRHIVILRRNKPKPPDEAPEDFEKLYNLMVGSSLGFDGKRKFAQMYVVEDPTQPNMARIYSMGSSRLDSRIQFELA